MKSTLFNARFFAIAGIIAVAVLVRFLPMPVNFSSIGAMALFAGFTFRNRVAAFALPMVALLITDMVIGFHNLMPVVYGTFALIVFIGMILRDQDGVMPKVLGSLLGSALFFVITNYAVWATSGMYPATQEGLVTSYMLAIPFLKNQIAGDLFFTAALFLGWAALEKSVPAVREVRA